MDKITPAFSFGAHMARRKPVVAANWKMNGNRQLVVDILKQFQGSSLAQDIDVVLSTPATLLDFANMQKQAICDEIILAAQSMSQLDSGAYTGEVNAGMLKSIGIQTVILGHSERRAYFNETNELLKQKVTSALKQGFTVIFCFGEELEDRKANIQEEVVRKQLAEAIFHLYQ